MHCQPVMHLEIQVLPCFTFLFITVALDCRGYPKSGNPYPPLIAIGCCCKVSAPAHEFTRPTSNWKPHLELFFTRWHQTRAFLSSRWAIGSLGKVEWYSITNQQTRSPRFVFPLEARPRVIGEGVEMLSTAFRRFLGVQARHRQWVADLGSLAY